MNQNPDSRFGHWSKKICWPFVLGILDDCKCSENFLALTITTPVRLSAIFSIQIVDWLCSMNSYIRTMNSYKLWIHNPSTIWIENVALSRIGVVIVGARKFSEHLQSSKMPKTNGQHIFFRPVSKPRIGPKWALEGFERIENWDTRFWTRNDCFLYIIGFAMI